MKAIRLTSPQRRLLLAIGLFALPVVLRVLFFYQFPYWNSGIQTPDYAGYSVAEAPTASSKVPSAAGVADGKIVLIDSAHDNQFQPDELEPYVTALSTRGARVEFDKGDKSLQSRLKYAAAYVIFSPGHGYSGDEVQEVRQFVANGGRLLVFTDPTHSLVQYDSLGNATVFPDVNFANPLLGVFGLSVENDYLYDLKKNEGNFRNVEFTGFARNPLTSDLKMVVMYGAHAVRTQGGAVLASGGPDVLSSLTDQGGGLSPMALGANGQVLALGDFTFLTNPYIQVADNDLLLAHLADFAIGGQRTPLLTNFPYLFQHPVSLITTGNVSLGSRLLNPVALLQQALKAVNTPLSVSGQAPADGDLIVLGTFVASDDMEPYLQPFAISLDNPDTIDLPGFGRVEKSGTGLLLFEHGPKTNTLVLLTGNSADLPALIKLVASGDLSGCVIQGDIGVCALGNGSSSVSSGSTSSSSISSGSISSFAGFYETATPGPSGP